MTIPSLGAFGGVQQPSTQKTSAQVQAALASLIAGQVAGDSDVAALSTATQLQSQTVGLRQAENNLAQGLSLAQVAQGGLTQIQNALGQMQTLAAQAAQNPND